MNVKSYLLNTILLSFSLFIGFVTTEIGFRMLLFGNLPAFETLREPGNYADYFSDDDYWKLVYHFGHKPPRHSHPVLGWVGDFSRESYVHDDVKYLRGRRPVLLYGDSFAGCEREVLCFQDLLNSDEEFSKYHYLLNYGVGNYGVDQIYLLFRNSVQRYDRPYVVISLMTLDLDRSILAVRVAQKPYFRIEEDRLQLSGLPINPNPDEYFANNPPRISSYVYRRILYGYLPEETIRWLRPGIGRIEEKQALNEKIILEMIKELRAKDIDFIFLIFHPHWPGVSTLDSESDWRDPFVKQLLEKNKVPYIWSKDLYHHDVKNSQKFSFEDYIDSANGHPTTHFNRLIAEEIKRNILKNPEVSCYTSKCWVGQ